jgi:hypothetical protein
MPPANDTVDDLFSGTLTALAEGTDSGIYDWTSLCFPVGFHIATEVDGPVGVPVLLDDNIQEPLRGLEPHIHSANLARPIDSNGQLVRHAVRDTIWQLIVLFLDEIHASMPVFKRSYLLDNLREQRNLRDRSFNALVHAISALVIFQMLQNSSGRRRKSFQIEQAEALLAEAVRLHSHADFGEAPVLENVLTSIFLFGCQFCKGNHHAARYRLSEAVTQAETMGLDDSQRYTNITGDEKERRLRTFLCLTVIHRYVEMLPQLYTFGEVKTNI